MEASTSCQSRPAAATSACAFAIADSDLAESSIDRAFHPDACTTKVAASLVIRVINTTALQMVASVGS